MKTYIKEIPGKAHLNEDSHYSSIFKNVNGEEQGLFCIADGWSGFSGTIASHLALKNIRDYLEPKLWGAQEKDYLTMIQKAIISASSELEGLTGMRTTLDIIIISKENLHLAHLGDSTIYLVYNDHCQQITEHEEEGGIPTNCIGASRLDRTSLEDRINFASFDNQEKTALGRFRTYKRIEILPRFIFMTTDGLRSRATEEEIKETLLRCGKYDDPGGILEKFSEIVYCPRKKLLSYDSATLRRKILYGVKDFKVEENITGEELVEQILKGYLGSASEELCQKLNDFLKFDDTTMVLIDLQDSVKDNLDKLKRLDTKTIPGLEGYEEKSKGLSAENASIRILNRGLAANLKNCFETLEERTKTVEDKEKEFQAFKNEHEGILSRLKTGLKNIVTNKRENYQKGKKE